VGDRRLAIAFLVPIIVLFGVFEFYPLVQGVIYSFNHINPYTFSLTFSGFSEYATVLSDPTTWHSLILSLIYIAGAIAFQVPVGLAMALLLNQGLRGQTLWRGLLLMPFVVPAIVTGVMFTFLFDSTSNGVVPFLLAKLSLVGRGEFSVSSNPIVVMVVIILVTSWRHTPFMTIVLLARLQTVPQDALEAAAVDGASAWNRFRHITLPWLMPVLLIAAMLRTIWTATEFDFPYLVAFGGPLQDSTVLPIKIYDLYTSEQHVGQAAALSVSLGILLACIAIWYLRTYRKVERALE
jgi:multiple sugar transport system permease protein